MGRLIVCTVGFLLAALTPNCIRGYPLTGSQTAMGVETWTTFSKDISTGANALRLIFFPVVL